MRIKRSSIMAADSIDWSVYLNGAFDELADQARKVDYDIEVDDNLKMTLKCTKDKKFMPEIEVETIEEDGIYYFNANLKFPDLDYDDMDYSDSAHYWVATRWEPVTRFTERINRFKYDPAEWQATEEIDVEAS